MKTMTCAQMGGSCDAKISGNTLEEIKVAGMAHVEEAHPEMAADIRATPAEDPKMVAWDEDMKAKFEATPEDMEAEVPAMEEEVPAAEATPEATA